jgi:hypothetical protein
MFEPSDCFFHIIVVVDVVHDGLIDSIVNVDVDNMVDVVLDGVADVMDAVDCLSGAPIVR